MTPHQKWVCLPQQAAGEERDKAIKIRWKKKKKEKGMRMWDELLTLTMHIVSLVVVNELNTDRNAITIRTHTPAVITHEK